MNFFMANRTFIIVIWFGTLAFVAYFFTKDFGGGNVSAIVATCVGVWGAKRSVEAYKGENNAGPVDE